MARDSEGRRTQLSHPTDHKLRLARGHGGLERLGAEVDGDALGDEPPTWGNLRGEVGGDGDLGLFGECQLHRLDDHEVHLGAVPVLRRANTGRLHWTEMQRVQQAQRALKGPFLAVEQRHANLVWPVAGERGQEERGVGSATRIHDLHRPKARLQFLDRCVDRAPKRHRARHIPEARGGIARGDGDSGRQELVLALIVGCQPGVETGGFGSEVDVTSRPSMSIRANPRFPPPLCGFCESPTQPRQLHLPELDLHSFGLERDLAAAGGAAVAEVHKVAIDPHKHGVGAALDHDGVPLAERLL